MSNNELCLDVMCGILSQLPVKALLRFKSVSKEWRSFVNDPYFVKLHLRPQSMEIDRNNLNINIILKERASGKLMSVGFDSVNLDNPRELNHPLKHLADGYDCTKVVCSWDGLVCLINENQPNRAMVLWNISTGDYKVLPYEPNELAYSKMTYGLGYDSINDDYKIVRIEQQRDVSGCVNEVKIYSLKTGAWRKGDQEIPNYWVRNFRKATATFLRGSIHWIGIRNWRFPDGIICFNVETEKFHLIELLESMGRICNVVLGALRGCLCTIVTCFDNKVKNVWIMKDYGVKESWTILYSLQGYIPSAANCLYPIAYSKNKDKILFEKNGIFEKEGISLLWYDINRNEFECENLLQLKNILPYHSDFCMESLVKLGD